MPTQEKLSAPEKLIVLQLEKLIEMRTLEQNELIRAGVWMKGNRSSKWRFAQDQIIFIREFCYENGLSELLKDFDI